MPKTKKSRIIVYLIFLAVIAGVSLAHGVLAFSLVEGISCIKTGDCTICDLLTVLHKVAQFIFVSMSGVALIFITWHALNMIMGFGNAEKVASAKKGITNAIIGVVIILVAWTLVNSLIFIISEKDKRGKMIWKMSSNWWTGPVCPPAKYSIPNTPATGCAGIITDGIKETQCADASYDLTMLLKCIKDKKKNFSNLNNFELIITSISDDYGLINCREANWKNNTAPAGQPANGCSHMKNSCHYGTDATAQSFAADFRSYNYTATSPETTAFMNLVKSCGGTYIDETNVVGRPHYHVSSAACPRN